MSRGQRREIAKIMKQLRVADYKSLSYLEFEIYEIKNRYGAYVKILSPLDRDDLPYHASYLTPDEISSHFSIKGYGDKGLADISDVMLAQKKAIQKDEEFKRILFELFDEMDELNEISEIKEEYTSFFNMYNKLRLFFLLYERMGPWESSLKACLHILSEVDAFTYGRKYLVIFGESNEEYIKLNEATKFLAEHAFVTKVREEQYREWNDAARS